MTNQGDCFRKKRAFKMDHGGTENTENHGDSVILCVLRASVIVFS
ncbi:MAG: hypothetical protein FD123_4244 [Bacteroidetes bacterium]|nr:MAG: hypothetical protein FD123_4244 [Bacteroidota bacterium]